MRHGADALTVQASRHQTGIAKVAAQAQIPLHRPCDDLQGRFVERVGTQADSGQLGDDETGQVRIVQRQHLPGIAGGGVSARVESISDLLTTAGFDVTRSTRIRYDIWYKLWGNMTMNPISALTGSTVDRVLDDPELRQFCTAAMLEAAAIGARIGCAVLESPEDRFLVTRKLGAFKTSMLQDVEAGRAIELDTLVGAVKEIGERVGVATPNISALLGLTRLFGQIRGIYPMARDAL